MADVSSQHGVAATPETIAKSGPRPGAGRDSIESPRPSGHLARRRLTMSAATGLDVRRSPRAACRPGRATRECNRPMTARGVRQAGHGGDVEARRSGAPAEEQTGDDAEVQDIAPGEHEG